MNKKAQGMPINVIIIVAVSLIVLVVLIAIFTGRMGGFVGGIEQTTTCDIGCQGIGTTGTMVKDTSCPAGKQLLPGTFSDVTSGQACCCESTTSAAAPAPRVLPPPATP